MTALAIPTLAQLAEGVDVDDLAFALAEFVAHGIPELDLRGAMAAAVQSEAYADALRRCTRTAEEAERAERLLEGVALEARRHAGHLLAGLDGGSKGSRKPSDRRQAAEEAQIERKEASRLVQLSQIPDEQVAAIAEHLEAKGSRITIGGVLKAAASPSAAPDYDGDEWYTPPPIIEAARRVFGEIDTDPGSCLVAQRHVRARAWYSKGQQSYDDVARASGLEADEAAELLGCWRGVGDIKDGRITQTLAGAVWCNPPYSCPGPFLLSILEAYGGGRGMVTGAILLLNVATDTAIQQRLLESSSARCWIRGRLAFLDPRGRPIKGNAYAQVIYYLGRDSPRFAAEFGEFGTTKRDI